MPFSLLLLLLFSNHKMFKYNSILCAVLSVASCVCCRSRRVCVVGLAIGRSKSFENPENRYENTETNSMYVCMYVCIYDVVVVAAAANRWCCQYCRVNRNR